MNCVLVYKKRVCTGQVARLDGQYRRTLIAGDMDSPRAIALDPRLGKCAHEHAYTLRAENGNLCRLKIYDRSN